VLQQLGGNVSLALLLTVSSNILGIFTMPFILPHIIAAAGPLTAAGGLAGGAALDPLPLLVQLCKTILVPTMIGATIRGFVPGGGGGHVFPGGGLCRVVPGRQLSSW
jgi:sodium/bile acid cotransporter 7